MQTTCILIFFLSPYRLPCHILHHQTFKQFFFSPNGTHVASRHDKLFSKPPNLTHNLRLARTAMTPRRPWPIILFLLSSSCSAQGPSFITNYIGDPEADMTVPQIIRHWGYPVEIHRVTTSDGYILQMHRIPRGKDEVNPPPNKPVVFLQHGLLCTSSVWLMNLPHQSAGMMFADAGFDVWLGNMRGNSYSRGHQDKNIPNEKYWHFSWDEMAKYDIEAMVNYVLNVTNQESLYYMGHSQGTLTMFSKLSFNDGFARKIKKFFAIAPVGTISYVKGLFRYLGERSYEQLALFTALFGDQEFLPNTFLSRWLTEFVCGLATSNPLCENFLFLVSGPDSQQLNKTRIGIYLAHNPAGTSIRNILHYCQMVRHKNLLAYDYGMDENMKHYGMVVPIEYDLRRISGVPIYLYYSGSDWLATEKDVEGYLLPKLRKDTVAEVNKLPDFNHNDFLWGLRAPDEIYRPIISIIQKDQPMNDPPKATTVRSVIKPASETNEDSDLLNTKENNPELVDKAAPVTEKFVLAADDDLLASSGMKSGEDADLLKNTGRDL